MAIQADEVTKILKSRIKDFKPEAELAEVGEVLKVGDGVAVIYGLKKAMAGELLKFPNEVYGIAFNLETDVVGAVLMGEVVTTFALIAGWCVLIGFRNLRHFTPFIIPFLYAVMLPLEATISGTSTNPARTFGPALISGQWHG